MSTRLPATARREQLLDVAVGVFAFVLGGRALWLVPLSFVAMMAVGFLLGIGQIDVPFVELGIVLSVIVLGLLVAAAVRLPLLACVLIVGLFALVHGHAHGAEIPAAASGLAFAIGFLVATAFLHLAGIGFGLLSQRVSTSQAVRLAGVAIAACGVYLGIH